MTGGTLQLENRDTEAQGPSLSLEHQQDISYEKDKVHRALQNVCPAIGECKDTDREGQNEHDLICVLQA